MAEILLNSRAANQPMNGVRRYIEELAGRLGERVRPVELPERSRGLSGHLWEQLVLPRQVGRGDLLWSPANTGPLSVASQVLTIHDLSSLEHPEWYRPGFALWYRFLLPRLARRVRRIITPSRFTKQRLVALLDIPQNVITLIPEGVADRFHPAQAGEIAEVRSRYGLHRPYLLAVGTLEPRKNLNRLFQAWQLAVGPEPAGRQPEVELAVAGGTGAAFRSLDYTRLASGVRLIGPPAEADLPALYAGAEACLVVSLYEGFGLPALEAMACGAPVIAADNTALPEVVGEAALLVDPYQVEQIAAAIRKILRDPDCRAGLRQKGLERARQFTWEQAAGRTWEVLQQALAEEAC